jgi:hypothetical protein
MCASIFFRSPSLIGSLYTSSSYTSPSNKAWVVFSICFAHLRALGGYSLSAVLLEAREVDGGAVEPAFFRYYVWALTLCSAYGVGCFQTANQLKNKNTQKRKLFCLN